MDLMGSGSTEVDDLVDNIKQLKISAPSLECSRACAILTKVTACLDVNSGQFLSFYLYHD